LIRPRRDAGVQATLPFHLHDYLQLLDDTVGVVRTDRRDFIDDATPHLFTQVGVVPGEWFETVTALQARYELTLGAPEWLRRLAVAWATQWVHGIRFARRLYEARAGCSDWARSGRLRGSARVDRRHADHLHFAAFTIWCCLSGHPDVGQKRRVTTTAFL